jgi:hypothetical protein
MNTRISSYDDTGICWQFRNKDDSARGRCPCPAHRAGPRKRELAYFGRCRSGKKWFWLANAGLGRHLKHGFADDEDTAIAAAMLAVREFHVLGGLMLAFMRHDGARDTLKEINQAKRATRQAANSKSRPVEYLYGGQWDSMDDRPVFYRFPITRRTARRVYYLRDGEEIDAQGEPIPDGIIKVIGRGEVGYVDRGKLEAEGQVYSASKPWRPDWTLYATLEGLLADRRRDEPEPADLAALKIGVDRC